MRRILLPICMAFIALIAYSQKPENNINLIVIKDIQKDSLVTLLRESFSTVNHPDYYKISITSTSETVSPVTNETEKNFIKKNLQRYLAGDTLMIRVKENSKIKSYKIYKTK